MVSFLAVVWLCGGRINAVVRHQSLRSNRCGSFASNWGFPSTGGAGCILEHANKEVGRKGKGGGWLDDNHADARCDKLVTLKDK
jgi:hypothetical protein